MFTFSSPRLCRSSSDRAAACTDSRTARSFLGTQTGARCECVFVVFHHCHPIVSIAGKAALEIISATVKGDVVVKHLDLRTEIDGWQASRGAVLEWEVKRLKVVLKFLGAPVAETETDVDELRRRLYELKRIIGPSTLERRVAMRTRVGNAVSAAAAKAAKGERVASSITVRVPSGSAEVFADWFTAESALVDSDAMLARVLTITSSAKTPGGGRRSSKPRWVTATDGILHRLR
jgi:hypothetical protein